MKLKESIKVLQIGKTEVSNVKFMDAKIKRKKLSSCERKYSLNVYVRRETNYWIEANNKKRIVRKMSSFPKWKTSTASLDFYSTERKILQKNNRKRR